MFIIHFYISDFIGCFKDNERTAFSHFMTNVKDVEMCIEICRQNALPYAGLQVSRYEKMDFLHLEIILPCCQKLM